MAFLKQALVLLAGWAVVCSAATAARERQSGPAFEVASVRPSSDATGRGTSFVSPGSFVATGVTLRMLIGYAYGIDYVVQRFLIVGGPQAVLDARFDISARAPEGGIRGEERSMLQALLAERFRLRAHRESRDLPVYALTVARSGRLGPDLRPSPHNCNAFRMARREGREVAEPRDRNNEPLCMVSPYQPDGYMARGAGTIKDLVAQIQPWLERPIVDATNLTGNFEWSVSFAPPVVRETRWPSIFAALPEQLGLRLEPRTAPVEVLVIDSVSMPDPN